jgi:chromosome segregation protein
LLDSVADHLEREGGRGWPEADDALGRASGMIQEVRRPGSEDAAARCAAALADLRARTAEVEQLDQDLADRTADQSALDCERARLDERLAALGASPEIGTSDAGPDPEQVRIELDGVVRELATIGPVDETAEHREQDILREEAALAPVLQDLTATRRQLASFLRQMEEHASSVFAQTLARVDARFRACCESLFQGAEARLEARPSDGEDSSDPPGVDVRVRLPRKPEVSLGLLSGGERSLVGLALILALAEGNGGEGRLLILDEVDAALDETNAARLALLLRDLQRDHQILCVTHNRLTMHQASRLVGVVAGASSGSTLVKVSLQSVA